MPPAAAAAAAAAAAERRYLTGQAPAPQPVGLPMVPPPQPGMMPMQHMDPALQLSMGSLVDEQHQRSMMMVRAVCYDIFLRWSYELDH